MQRAEVVTRSINCQFLGCRGEPAMPFPGVSSWLVGRGVGYSHNIGSFTGRVLSIQCVYLAADVGIASGHASFVNVVDVWPPDLGIRD